MNESCAMMKLRRAEERHRLHLGEQSLWLSFFPSGTSDPLARGFGSLTTLNEGLLAPEGNMLAYSRRGAERITYVVKGTLLHNDRENYSRLMHAGDFERASVDHSDHVSYVNASARVQLHVLQFCLLGQDKRGPRRETEQKSFPTADRQSPFCLVGSGDGRRGSLRLDRDASIYSCMIGAGETVVHALAAGRIAWLQVLRGGVALGDTTLGSGDGAGITRASTLVMSAQVDTEILLFDLEGLRLSVDDRDEEEPPRAMAQAVA